MTVQSARQHLAQVCAQVPLDAKPGQSLLKLRTDSAHAVEITLPETANPGETLVLTKFEDGWQVGIGRFSLPATIELPIPRDATPGVTELPVMYQNFEVTKILVPPVAKPAVDDLLAVRPDDPESPWGVTVLQDPDHPEAIKAMCVGASQAALRAAPVDPEVAFKKLVEALNQAGAYVNPKIVRGRAPPLNVPGILAREDIAEGETIFKVPKHLHVSQLTAEACVPKFYQDCFPNHLAANSADECARYAMLARLLHEAEARAEGNSEEDTVAEVDPKIRQVWKAYADQLLSEDFTHHPLRRMGENPEAMQELFRPSSYETHLYKEVRRVHTLYRETAKASTLLAGKRFESGMFLRAMLNFQSRQFKAAVSASLVPGSDLLNHAPAEEMCVAWSWREDEQAHVLKCVRSVTAGTELLQSYGNHANSCFYRCYGFTQLPRKETTWSYSVWKSDFEGIFSNFVSKGSVAHKSEVHLSTYELSKSLKDVLTEIAKAGSNPAFFLRLVCSEGLKKFQQSEKLKPALQSLEASRKADPPSNAWWEHLNGPDAALADDEIARIQMSDYLCLVAYLEAVAFAAGEVDDKGCLRLAKTTRDRLKEFLLDLYARHPFN